MISGRCRLVSRDIWKCCRVRCYSKNAINIDASKLEFTKRNEIIQNDISHYYPSLSTIDIDQSYKHIALDRFHAVFDNNQDQDQPIDDSSKLFYVNGRIKNIRFSGKKICFIDLYNQRSSSILQLIVNFSLIPKNSQAVFQDTLQLLKVGDYIQSYGYPGLSQSRQKTLSLKCTELPKILSPAQLPLPPRLNDTAKIKNNRVVDYQVNGVETLLLRHSIVKSLRDFLNSLGFIEVETPILSSRSNGAAAEPFVTSSNSLPKDSKTLELRIAPELWLKRLIVGGLDKVYEIGKVFRNEGVDAYHNPEFTTLEFYQSFTSMEQLVQLSEELLKRLLIDLRNIHTNNVIEELYAALENADWKFKRVEFLPTLSKELGVDLSAIDLNDPEKLYQVIPDKDFPKNLSPQQILNKLCSQYIESRHCNSILPTLIYHHPTVMSPLAKTNPLDLKITKRFEVFIKGQEYINAYEEENCPQWQLSKFEQQQSANENYGDKESLPVDYNYVEAMKWGMPPIGGFGLGVDRICMLLLNKTRIEDVLTFGCIDDVNRQ